MFGRRSQRDFEDEIRSHLQMEVDRLTAQGMSPTEAERAARRSFGNVGVAEDRFYHAQRFAWLEDGVRDLRHAWRSLRRTPGFLVAAIGTLALAIGAVAGMFDVVHTVMLRPLVFPQPDRLVVLAGTAPGSDLPDHFNLGSEFYLYYKEQSKLLRGIFAWSGGTSTFRTADRVERIRMAWPTNDMYATLGVRPQLGRVPVAADNDQAVVISDALWSGWFGRDPSVVGKWYFVDGMMRRIVGVMPRDFQFPNDSTLLWVSSEIQPGQVHPGSFDMTLVARMKDGVTRQQLESELTGLAKALPARFGGSSGYARTIGEYRSIVTPLRDAIVGPALTTSLWVLLGAVGVVLLIACANIANLFLVRAESRRRDLTVRRAIGASRGQLVRLLMAESAVVALAAGGLALVLAGLTLPLFVRAAPLFIPRLGDARLDWPTATTTFGLVVVVALACGIGPALRASSPDLAGLRDGGRGATGRRAWGRDLLVVAQTALALVLLIGSALLVESFQRLRHVDPGYDVRGIYTFQFAPDQPGLHDGPSFGRMHLAFMDRLRALPGVTTVGIVNNVPLDEGTDNLRVWTDEMSSGADPLLVRMNFTGGDYFKAMRIPLLRGRAFTNTEAITPNRSVIVSRSAANKFWLGQDPLGRQLRPRFGSDDTVRFTVVGEVGDVKQDDWRQSGEATVYFPLTGPYPTAWEMSSPAYVVKSTRADHLKRDVRALVHEIAPEAPVYREYTMESLAAHSMIQLSFTMLTLGVVSALALLLGVLGLYGVLSYVVAQRTREIGVRMALGATATVVRRHVVAQGGRVVLAGIVIGIGAALASTRLLGTLLYGVKAVDPAVFAAMSVMMIGVGVLASYLPARRASNVNPTEALRSD